MMKKPSEVAPDDIPEGDLSYKFLGHWIEGNTQDGDWWASGPLIPSLSYALSEAAIRDIVASKFNKSQTKELRRLYSNAD